MPDQKPTTKRASKPAGIESSFAGYSREGRQRYLDVLGRYMTTRPWELPQDGRSAGDDKRRKMDPGQPVLRPGERPSQLAGRARLHAMRDELVRSLARRRRLTDDDVEWLIRRLGYSDDTEKPRRSAGDRGGTGASASREAWEIAVKEALRKRQARDAKELSDMSMNLPSIERTAKHPYGAPYLGDAGERYRRYASDLSSDYPRKRPEDFGRPPKEKYVPIRFGRKDAVK